MHKKWHSMEDISSNKVFSPVTKQKNLRLIKKQTGESFPQSVVLDGVFHDLRNCLQSISIGADLLQFDRPETVESRTITLGIERASRLLRDVQEYCFPPEPHLSIRTLNEALIEAIHAIENRGDDFRIQLHDSEMFPPFQHDWLALGRAFERVFRCAWGMLPSKGGEIFVGVRIHRKRTRSLMEIQTDIHGKEELEVDEDKVFLPFWKSSNYQAGLGPMLAHQTVQKYGGQLTFKKTSPCRAHFSLLLDVLPKTAVSVEVEQGEDHVYVE